MWQGATFYKESQTKMLGTTGWICKNTLYFIKLLNVYIFTHGILIRKVTNKHCCEISAVKVSKSTTFALKKCGGDTQRAKYWVNKNELFSTSAEKKSYKNKTKKTGINWWHQLFNFCSWVSFLVAVINVRVSCEQRVTPCGRQRAPTCRTRRHRQAALSLNRPASPRWLPPLTRVFFFFFFSAGVAFLSLPVVVCSCGRYTDFPPRWTFKILINLRVVDIPAQEQPQI